MPLEKVSLPFNYLPSFVNDCHYYTTYMTNNDIHQEDDIILLKTSSCFGYIGDTISHYYFGESETEVYKNYAFRNSLNNHQIKDEMNSKKNFAMIFPKNDLGIENLLEVSNRWNLGVKVYEIENQNELVLIIGAVEKIFKTFWQFQALMQIYRYCSKYGVARYIPSMNSSYQRLWEISKLEIEFGKEFEFINSDPYFKKIFQRDCVKKISQSTGVMSLGEEILKRANEQIKNKKQTS